MTVSRACFAGSLEKKFLTLARFTGLAWTDVQIRRGDSGRPELAVGGTVAEAARALGVARWHLSLSHDAGVSVAMVIAEA